MRKYILLIILASILVPAFSQKVEHRKDEFTGDEITGTTYVNIGDGFVCAIRIINNNPPVLLVTYNCGHEMYAMEKDAAFMLKLQNDSIITLKNLEYREGEYWRFNSSNIWHYNLNTEYILSHEDINHLKTTPITTVRFYTTSGYIERKVSKGNAKKLLKLFNLI